MAVAPTPAVRPTPETVSPSIPVVPVASPSPIAPVMSLTAAGATASEARADAIQLGSHAPAITETLNQTLEMLSAARDENARLRDDLAGTESRIAEKDRTIADLRTQLEEGDAKILALEAALDQWKQDVLGFRDEMRKAEEAEIEVLQKILVLLEGYKEE